MHDYQEYLKNKGFKKRTITEHLSVVNQFNQYLDKENINLSETGYNDVVGYINTLTKANIQNSTKRIRIGILRHYFSYLILINQIVSNPLLDLKIKRQKNRSVVLSLSEDQLEAIYDRFISYDNFLRQRDRDAHRKHCIALGLIIYQALDTSDLNRLLLTDFNLYNGILELPNGNRSNKRVLKLEAKQLILLIDYFKNKQGEKLFDGSVRVLLETITKKLKVITGEHYPLKQLRESRIIVWLRQYKVRKTQYLCGFKYVSSLDKYRVSEVEDLRRKIEAVFG